jgi:hypothetical protein
MSNQYELIQTLCSPLPGSTVGTTYIGDGYGAAVSLEDDHLVVSVQEATVDCVSDAGAITFYKKDHEHFHQSQPFYSELLTGDVPGAYNSLKIKGKWAMCTVGAAVSGGPGPAPHPGGAVLVFHFEHDKWKLVQTLTPPGPTTYTYDAVTYGIEFGGQFPDFDDEWAFIGAPQNIVNNVPLAGNVYVYHLVDCVWTYSQTITSPSGIIFNQAFGGACYIHGKYAFISAEGNYTQFGTYPPDNGYAYFFQLDEHTCQWNFVQLLRGTAPTPPSPDGLGDLFGFRVQFNDDWAFVGAPLDSTNSGSVFLAGAVYFYKAICNAGVKNWQFVTKIYSAQPAVQGAFGTNLFLHGEHLYITDNRSTPDLSLKHVGAVIVYVEQNGCWNYLTTVLNPNPRQLDFFGSNMSANSKYLVVGMNPNFAYYLPYVDVTTPSSFNNGNVNIFKH